MKTFLVIATGTNPVNQDQITKVFDLNYTITANLVWMIASPNYTTATSVCNALGIYPVSEINYSGIVVDLSIRNGFASEELVNTLHSWEEA